MILSKGKLYYKNSAGSYVELVLTSCDVVWSQSQSRDNWDRQGSYTNELIDNIEINFNKDDNTEWFSLNPGDEIDLKWSEGDISYLQKFSIGQKYKSKTNGITNVFERMTPVLGSPMEIKTAGGGSGGVTQEYVDEHDASTLASAKSYVDTKVANKLDKATTTSGLYSYIRNNANDTTMSIGQSTAAANTIAARTSTGTIVTAAPTADQDASTKKYVDDSVSGKADKDPASADFKIGYDAGGIYIIK